MRIAKTVPLIVAIVSARLALQRIQSEDDGQAGNSMSGAYRFDFDNRNQEIGPISSRLAWTRHAH